MLLSLHHQFDVLTDRNLPDFRRYEVLVLADRAVATPETARRLREYVAGGGKLLLSHEALSARTAASCSPTRWASTTPGRPPASPTISR